jgi:hypothetical protein
MLLFLKHRQKLHVLESTGRSGSIDIYESQPTEECYCGTDTAISFDGALSTPLVSTLFTM